MPLVLIDPLEMVCVNPWQLWPLLPGGDTRCLAQLTCNAAYVDQFFLELYGHSLGGFLNRPVSIGNPLFALINRHISENRLESSGRSLTLDSIAEELLSELMHRAVEAGAAMERKKTFCPDVIDAVIDYLYEHMEESITDADLARYTNVDMGSMLRQFKQAVATTPMGYLIELRTARAKELLIQSDVGISKIARMCGFVSPVNFTVTFKRKIGLSPSEFRQKAQLPPGSCSTQDR